MTVAERITKETRARIVFVVLFLGGLALLILFLHRWPWPTIGVALAFGGTLLMLLRNSIEDYGNRYTTQKESESGFKPLARAAQKYIYATGVPLVILGALYQMIGHWNNKNPFRTNDIASTVSFLAKDAKQRTIDQEKLDQSLQTLQANQKSIESYIARFTYLELLVVNCGTSTECHCPEPWTRVRDTGNWNLNAGVKGDSITLCQKRTAFDTFVK